mgnify:CR=1 FL=1
MAMQTDVKATTGLAGATTVVYEGRTRFKGVTISYTTGGNVTVKDGTTTMWSFVQRAAAGRRHSCLWQSDSNLHSKCNGNGDIWLSPRRGKGKKERTLKAG